MTTDVVPAIDTPTPLVKLLFGIIDRPMATFESVGARRDKRMWAIPLLIGLVCFSLMMVIQAPYTLELARQQALRQLDSMPPEQADAARAQIGTFVSLPVVLISGLGVGGMTLVIGVLAQSAVLYFGALVLGGEINFGSVFKMSTWSRLPYALSYLILAGFTALAGHSVQYTGLAALVATGNITKDSSNPLLALLGMVDLFWLWHLVLVVVGLSVLVRFSRSKSLGLTLLYAMLSLVVSVLPSLLFRGAV